MQKTQVSNQTQSIRFFKTNLTLSEILKKASGEKRDVIRVVVDYRDVYVVTYLNPFRNIKDVMAKYGMRYAGSSSWKLAGVEERVRNALNTGGYEKFIEEHMRIAEELIQKIVNEFSNAIIVLEKSRNLFKDYGLYEVRCE